MKEILLEKITKFRQELKNLKRELSNLSTESVSRKKLREQADKIATFWVEELRSPLEHKYKIDKNVIADTSEAMKRLHVLSRPNNRKSSYIQTIDSVLYNFDNKLILPIKQLSTKIDSSLNLSKIINASLSSEESEYLNEAVACAQAGHYRAAVVLGWCATIDRIQRKLLLLGMSKLNETSSKLKSQDKGKFKRWNKEFSISTLSELQAIFDTDLIVLLEGMDLVDGNQAERLRTCFEYRNHSAHPGQAPIKEPHVISFFSDINHIIFENDNFSL